MNSHDLPQGRAILDSIWKAQDEVQSETDRRLPSMGAKAPACFEEIGTAVSYLDLMASCGWGCRGGDHLIEYLCGRATSQTLAALRLMRFGSYDEALLLCRGVGEIANLLYLFQTVQGTLDDWKTASKAQRMARYSPVKVRIRLSEAGSIIPIDQHRYDALSERAAHVTPQTKPQAHNPLGVPSAGTYFQDAGLLVCINEIGLALSLVIVGAAPLLGLDKQRHCEVLEATRGLVAQLGKLSVTTIDECFRELYGTPYTREHLVEVEQALRGRQKARRRALEQSSPPGE